MTETDIHKCILAYGLLAINKVLKELETEEEYEKCVCIYNAILSFKARFKFVLGAEKEFEEEKEYYQYFENTFINNPGKYRKIAESNMEWYIKDIKQRLKL